MQVAHKEKRTGHRLFERLITGARDCRGLAKNECRKEQKDSVGGSRTGGDRWQFPWPEAAYQADACRGRYQSSLSRKTAAMDGGFGGSYILYEGRTLLRPVVLSGGSFKFLLPLYSFE